MAKINPKTRISTYYGINKTQETIDFIDVPIGTDVQVYLDPSRIRAISSEWANECSSLLQYFFEVLLEKIASSDKDAALKMLQALSERNEFHLGQSKGLSDGRAFGPGYIEKIWQALSKSRAGISGLLQDLEDSCLFIEGVGPDRISDAACNILRGPLIRYTQDMCDYYGIPMQNDVPSGPIWNPQENKWEDTYLRLPTTSFGKVIFVPKIIVRHEISYDAGRYYTQYLLPIMQDHEKSLNTGLVHTLRDGRRRVTKKDLKEKYGATKLAIVEQSIKHPNALDLYRQDQGKKSVPIDHIKLAKIENIDYPRFEKLLDAVVKLPVGAKAASAYEGAIEALLTALFYPSLSYPRKQHPIHEGRKRIDITYQNTASSGFFNWMSMHYSSANIFVECKNYGNEIENPEFDQLAGRFSPSRGQFGILICRSVRDPIKIAQRCVDTAKDQRGYIVVLTDHELGELVKNYIGSNGSSDYPILLKKFRQLT